MTAYPVVPPCPAWCRETHSEDEARTRSADHVHVTMFESRGAGVYLHRSDVHGEAGPVRVVVNADASDAVIHANGSVDVRVSPDRARRIALALLTAVADLAATE